MTALGPCDGRGYATELRATVAAHELYGTTGTHRCPAGHVHPNRPTLAARVGRAVRRAVAS